jgi:membrane protease YdiL (CAAX protease family)
LDSAHLRSAQNLAEELSSVPLAHLLACLAVAPAVLEECFFRGVLFAAFRHHIGVLAAVLLSSLAFGLFHVVAPTALALDRFAPSTLLGIALAWARHRTGSLFPSILLHALYNSLLLLVVYYRDQLPAGGWWMQPDVHLPWVLLVVAAAAAAVGAPLLRSARRLPTAGCERPREASP